MDAKGGGGLKKKRVIYKDLEKNLPCIIIIQIIALCFQVIEADIYLFIFIFVTNLICVIQKSTCKHLCVCVCVSSWLPRICDIALSSLGARTASAKSVYGTAHKGSIHMESQLGGGGTGLLSQCVQFLPCGCNLLIASR